jgi:hypothetical protein
MVSEVELSPNALASCHNCHRKIKHDEKRYIEYYNFQKYRAKRYYCDKCGVKELISEIKQLENEIREKRRLLK